MENTKNIRNVCVGQIYRHFKGKLYQIVAVARHSETGESLVIYQQLYGRFEVYARPFSMFVSEVDRIKYPKVKQKYRFELINKEELDAKDMITENIGIQNVNTEETDGNQICSQNMTEKSSDSFNMENNLSIKNNQNLQDIQDNETNSDYDSVNPYLIRFLDADTYEEKRNILMRIKGELTDRLIDDIAASMDVTVDKGDIDERFASLLNCVDMMAKFEVTRFRR